MFECKFSRKGLFKVAKLIYDYNKNPDFFLIGKVFCGGFHRTITKGSYLILFFVVIFFFQILFNLQDNTQPTGPVGSITFIKNSDGQRLSHVMGDYYTQFQVNTGANVTFSVPHREPNTGKTLVISCNWLKERKEN